MKKLLQLALITGSLLTGKLFAADGSGTVDYQVATPAGLTDNQRALFYAIATNNVAWLQALPTAEHATLQTRFTGIFTTDTRWALDRHTILHIAAHYNAVAVIAWLLDNKIFQVDIRSGRSTTALHVAAQAGHLEAVTFLVTRGAHVNATTPMGKTPFRCAFESGNTAVMSFLGDHGAVMVVRCDADEA